MNGIIHFLTHVLMQYVPFVLFMVVLVVQVGLPVPAIPFLIAAGILVGAGQMMLGAALGLAVLAVLLGDQFRDKLGRQPDRREVHPGSGTIVPPPARAVDIRKPQYLLYHGVGTILLVGSGIGVGYAFGDRLAEAASVVAYLGPMTALILLGVVVGYIILKTLHRSAGKDPAVIDLRPHGTRQDVSSIQGSLALAVAVRPGTRWRRRSKL